MGCSEMEGNLWLNNDANGRMRALDGAVHQHYYPRCALGETLRKEDLDDRRELVGVLGKDFPLTQATGEIKLRGRAEPEKPPPGALPGRSDLDQLLQDHR